MSNNPNIITMGRFTIVLSPHGAAGTLAEVRDGSDWIGSAVRDTRDQAAIEAGFIIAQRVAKVGA